MEFLPFNLCKEKHLLNVFCNIIKWSYCGSLKLRKINVLCFFSECHKTCSCLCRKPSCLWVTFLAHTLRHGADDVCLNGTQTIPPFPAILFSQLNVLLVILNFMLHVTQFQTLRGRFMKYATNYRYVKYLEILFELNIKRLLFDRSKLILFNVE